MPEVTRRLVKKKQQMIPNEEGKFNESDNEMVQLTKIILKQTARHIIPYQNALLVRGESVWFGNSSMEP